MTTHQTTGRTTSRTITRTIEFFGTGAPLVFEDYLTTDFGVYVTTDSGNYQVIVA